MKKFVMMAGLIGYASLGYSAETPKTKSVPVSAEEIQPLLVAQVQAQQAQLQAQQAISAAQATPEGQRAMQAQTQAQSLEKDLQKLLDAVQAKCGGKLQQGPDKKFVCVVEEKTAQK